MKSRTRSRKPASIGLNHSSRTPTAISAFEPRTGNFVLLLVMAWSPPAHNAGSFGFQHPETTPPLIPTTLRTAPSEYGAADYRHAALVALRYCAAASDRKIRGVDRETRCRWRLKVLWTAA